MKTTSGMATLICCVRGMPLVTFWFLLKGPLVPFFVGRIVASDTKTLPPNSPLKTTRARTPQRGTPPDLKAKVDVSKVDVKGFPKPRSGVGGSSVSSSQAANSLTFWQKSQTQERSVGMPQRVFDHREKFRGFGASGPNLRSPFS